MLCFWWPCRCLPRFPTWHFSQQCLEAKEGRKEERKKRKEGRNEGMKDDNWHYEPVRHDKNTICHRWLWLARARLVGKQIVVSLNGHKTSCGVTTTTLHCMTTMMEDDDGGWRMTSLVAYTTTPFIQRLPSRLSIGSCLRTNGKQNEGGEWLVTREIIIINKKKEEEEEKGEEEVDD